MTTQSDVHQLIKMYSTHNKDISVTSCNHYLHFKCYQEKVIKNAQNGNKTIAVCPICRRCESSFILLPILPSYDSVFRSRSIQTPCYNNQLRNKTEFISLLKHYNDGINKQLLIDSTVATDYPFRVPLHINCHIRWE